MSKSFLLLVIVATAVIAAFQVLAFQYVEYELSEIYFILYIYFPVTTILIHFILNKKLDQRPQAFVTAFMGSMSAKLFISLILLLIVIYTNREVRVPFAILFMAMYAVFTILSTSVLFKKLRSKKE